MNADKLLDAFLHPSYYANKSEQLLHAFTKHSDKLLNSSWSDKLNNMWSMIWEFGDSVSGSFWLFVLEVVLLMGRKGFHLGNLLFRKIGVFFAEGVFVLRIF